MNTSLLLLYMTLGEVTLAACVIGAYLIIRHRKKIAVAQTTAIAQPAQSDPPDFNSHIQNLIRHTREKISDANDNDSRLLNSRILFLESEASALADNPDDAGYWTNITRRLENLLPQEKESSEKLAELDDLDLTGEEPGKEKQTGSITIDTSQQEISRLRNIINRQHGSMDELKQAMLKQGMNAEESEKISAKMEEIEVAHAQLNMCVEILEKENIRLTELAEQAQSAENSMTVDETTQVVQQELSQANERIENLENENTKQSEYIDVLQNEISSLKTVIKQNEEELARIELMTADLSRVDDDDENSNADVLKKQITELNDMLSSKNEELQELQNIVQKESVVVSDEHTASSITDNTQKNSLPDSENDFIDSDDIPVLQPYDMTADPESTLDDTIDEILRGDTELANDENPTNNDMSDASNTASKNFYEYSKDEFFIETDDADIVVLTDTSDTSGFDEADIVMEDDLYDSPIDDEIDNLLSDNNQISDAVDTGDITASKEQPPVVDQSQTG